MGEKTRIEYIDLAKGVCIILVVLMHIVPEIGGKNPYLWNLRMPFYFCLSGIFFKTYSGFSNFLIKKTDKLLLPFIAWYLISYGIYYLRVLAIGYPEHVYKFTDLFFEPEFYNGPIWFLLSLFWVNLVYYGVTVISKNEAIKATLILFISSIGWMGHYLDLDNFLYIGTSLTCLPFFYIGTLLMRRGVISPDKNLKRDWIIVSICLAGIFLSIWLPEHPALMRFYINHLEEGNPLQLYFSSFCLIVLTLTLCKYIKKLPFVSYVGRFSIIVLVTHWMVRNIIIRSLAHLTGFEIESWSLRLILFFVVMGSMLLIIPFCKKYMASVCAQTPWLEKRIIKKREAGLESQ